MNQTIKPARVRPTGRDVRQLLLGQGVGTLTVTRQAYRVRPTDTDEVVAIADGRDHWVASRIGDRIAIWACPDVIGADEKFESLTPASDGWVEARPSSLVSGAA